MQRKCELEGCEINGGVIFRTSKTGPIARMHKPCWHIARGGYSPAQVTWRGRKEKGVCPLCLAKPSAGRTYCDTCIADRRETRQIKEAA